MVDAASETEIDLQLPFREFPPEGLMCKLENVLVPSFRAYDSNEDPEFQNGPDTLPIVVEGLVEPPYAPSGVQKAAGSVLMSCSDGVRFSISDDEYALFLKNDVSMGDIGYKVAQGLQKRIKITPLVAMSNVQGQMTLQFVFYPLAVHDNSSNTNNAG